MAICPKSGKECPSHCPENSRIIGHNNRERFLKKYLGLNQIQLDDKHEISSNGTMQQRYADNYIKCINPDS